MVRGKSNFICQQCGYVSPSFLGRCPNCGTWGSLVETALPEPGRASRGKTAGRPAVPVRLSEIKAAAIKRTPTGIPELDRVLGGGVVPGMAVLLAGEPGIGKSTLLLELARSFKGAVLYVAGEESASQIKIRAERLGVKTENVLILEEADVDRIVSGLAKAGLVIVDSIQTLYTSDLTGSAGSVGQIRECASRLISATKPLGMPLFLVGHVTKEGTIAGPKVLEHIVDTVLNLEGDRFAGLRIARAAKNRFGPTDEVGVFEMSDAGLVSVSDYEKLFMNPADKGAPGSCLTVAMEGTRAVLVEIQALATSTPLPSPRRVGSGVDYARLQLVIAVLQKRLGLPLYKEDVYVSVSGGLRIEEPAVDLAIALATVSSFRDKPLPAQTVGIGEVDLLGNIRRVNSLEKRIKEARRLGFKNILTAENLSSLGKLKL